MLKKDKYIFKPNWIIIVFDTLKDLCFFVRWSFIRFV